MKQTERMGTERVLSATAGFARMGAQNVIRPRLFRLLPERRS